MRQQRQSGFTLIELLVVIAVISVLSTLVMITINPLEQISRANDVKLKQGMATVYKAFMANYIVNGSVMANSSGSWGQQPFIDSGDLAASVNDITYDGPNISTTWSWMPQPDIQVTSVQLKSKQSRMQAKSLADAGDPTGQNCGDMSLPNVFYFTRFSLSGDIHYWCY